MFIFDVLFGLCVVAALALAWLLSPAGVLFVIGWRATRRVRKDR